MRLICKFNTIYKKMHETIDYIERINCLNHRMLSEYLKDMLLSIDPQDIAHAIFFKTSYVLLNHLPSYLTNLKSKLNERKEHFVNLWDDFKNNTNVILHIDTNVECMKR